MFRNLVTLIESVDDVPQRDAHDPPGQCLPPLQQRAAPSHEGGPMDGEAAVTIPNHVALESLTVAAGGPPRREGSIPIISPSWETTTNTSSPSSPPPAVVSFLSSSSALTTTTTTATHAVSDPPDALPLPLSAQQYTEVDLQIARRRVEWLEAEVKKRGDDIRQRDALLQRCGAAKATIDDVLRSEIEAVLGGWQRVEGGGAEVAVDVATLTDELSTLRREWARCSEHDALQIAALREEVVRWRASSSDQAAQVAVTSSELGSLREKYEEVEAKWRSTAIECERRREELGMNRTQVVAFQSAISSLTASLTEARSQVQRLQQSNNNSSSVTIPASPAKQHRSLDASFPTLAATAPAASVAATRLYRAVERRRFGPEVLGVLRVVDRVALFFGSVLLQHPWLRVLLVGYLLVLHLLHFHVASFHFHGMAHSGDDVHDHLKFHMK